MPSAEIQKAVRRSFNILSNEDNIEINVSDDAVKYISTACGGDVRKAMNAVELCTLSTLPENGVRIITLETASQLTQRSAMRYDKDGDQHYDAMSAFQKSMRGSDANAAIYYLARLLSGGDLPSACRRLLVCACEDVGLAYPQIIPIVKSCVDIALQVGMPEAKYLLLTLLLWFAMLLKATLHITLLHQQQQILRRAWLEMFQDNCKICIMTVRTIL